MLPTSSDASDLHHGRTEPEPAPDDNDPLLALFTRESARSRASASASDLREDLRGRLFGAAPPARIGRYTLERSLGEGGMGVVYLAHDPKLQRAVALKLLHPEPNPASRDRRRLRLLREAQGLARLSHPNVVPIHDVDVHGEQLFLVMEYIAGATLNAWLAAAPRSWREVVRVLGEVGEGLAAAHAVGLVHRDLKPSNILIGDDGRARLIDFGLVRQGDATADSDPDLQRPPTAEQLAELADLEDSPALAAEITVTGAMIGTLAYIAPEVLAGGRVDVRADIYSFCVTLYEALYRQRPFHAATREGLICQILEGRPRTPPRTGAPRWLARLCQRGLAKSPAHRPESMAALLAALAQPPARRPTWLLSAACVALSVVVSAVALTHAPSEPPITHTELRQQLHHDALERRLRAAAQLAAEGRYDALKVELSALQTIAEQIDADDHLAEIWRLRGLVELSLDDPHARASLVIADGLSHRQPSVIAAQISALSPAEDPEPWLYLAHHHDSSDPRDEATLRAALADLAISRGDLLTARAERLAVCELRERHLAEGDPQLAAAWNNLGAAHDRLGELPEARRAYERALALRERHLRPGHPEIAAVLTNLAGLQLAEGDPGGARRSYERALEISRAAFGPVHPRVATILHNLGVLARKQGDHAEAVERHRGALAIYRAVEPTDPVAIASALNALGVTFKRSGDLGAAEAAYREALALRERALGPRHPDIASTAGSLANLLVERAEHDEAIALLSRAEIIFREQGPPGEPDLAWILRIRGAAHLGRGETAAAREDLGRSLRIAEAALERDPDLHAELDRARQLLARAR
jgi:serine/threonine protein kinase/Flp pilus assembly protein TadD